MDLGSQRVVVGNRRSSDVVGMVGDRGRKEMCAPVGRAAATPVERVRAQHGVADRNEPDGSRFAVDDEVAPLVQETRHHVDVGGDRLGPPVEPRGRGRQRASCRIERRRIRQAATEFVVVGRDGECDAEGPVVADERAVLDVAEVAPDRPGARRDVGVGQEPVEATCVHDPGVLHGLGHLAGADLGQPLGHRTPASVRRDHAPNSERICRWAQRWLRISGWW